MNVAKVHFVLLLFFFKSTVISCHHSKAFFFLIVWIILVDLEGYAHLNEHNFKILILAFSLDFVYLFLGIW